MSRERYTFTTNPDATKRVELVNMSPLELFDDLTALLETGQAVQGYAPKAPGTGKYDRFEIRKHGTRTTTVVIELGYFSALGTIGPPAVPLEYRGSYLLFGGEVTVAYLERDTRGSEYTMDPVTRSQAYSADELTGWDTLPLETIRDGVCSGTAVMSIGYPTLPYPFAGLSES